MRSVKTRLIISILLIASGLTFWFSYHEPWSISWIENQRFYYQLLWKGQKSGHVELIFKSDAHTIEINQSTHISVINQQQPFKVTEYESLTFEKNSGNLIQIDYHRRFADDREDINLLATDLSFNGSRTINFQKQTLENINLDYRLADYLNVMQWIRSKPSIGDELMAKRLDPRNLTSLLVNYRVIEQLDNEKLQVSFDEQGKDWQGTAIFNKDGTPLNFQVGNLVEQQLTSQEAALQEPQLIDYFYSNLVKVDKPLGDFQTLDRLVVKASSQQLASYAINQRQYLDSYGNFVINSQALVSESATIGPNLNSNSSEEIPLYLKALADDITTGATSDVQKATRLMNYVHEYLNYSPVIKPVSIDEIMATKQGDCTEHTRLLNAFAQVLGLKTREVHGLVYLGDEYQGFGGHVWSEVRVGDKWYTLDATLNMTRLSVGHIRFKETMITARQPNQQLSVVSIQ